MDKVEVKGHSGEGLVRAGQSLPLLDLCIVVLNYNGGALLERAVNAAAHQSGLTCGVVVVDNASTDGSFDALWSRIGSDVGRGGGPPGRHGHAGRYLLLRTGENLGYAGGNNVGLFGFPARYIVLLNNDAIVEPGTLPAMLRFMDAHPAVGACGPRLSWPDGTPQPFSHGGDPTPAYLWRRTMARRAGQQLHDWGDGAAAGGEEVEGRSQESGGPRPVDWVAGTCLMLRATALGSVGLLDERIFMYFEDNDLCLRLRGRGWGVYFLPGVSVRHHNRPSHADRQRMRNYYRGLARFYATHYGRAGGMAIRLAGEAAAALRGGESGGGVAGNSRT